MRGARARRTLHLRRKVKHSRDVCACSKHHSRDPGISGLYRTPVLKEDLRMGVLEKNHPGCIEKVDVSYGLKAYGSPGPYLHTGSPFHLSIVGGLFFCVVRQCMCLLFHYSDTESKAVALRKCQQVPWNVLLRKVCNPNRKEKRSTHGAFLQSVCRQAERILQRSFSIIARSMTEQYSAHCYETSFDSI